MHSGIPRSWILVATVTGECEMKDISQNYHRAFVLMGYLTSLPGPNPTKTMQITGSDKAVPVPKRMRRRGNRGLKDPRTADVSFLQGYEGSN